MSEAAYDIVALGECLVDMVETSEEGGRLFFTGNAGGAPANVLAAATRFGSRCAFIGKAGNDAFGRFLFSYYAKHGIDVSGAVLSDKEPTTLAFVTLSEDGDRSFSFYRNETADCMIRREEVNKNIISGCSIFHFGAVSLTEPVCTDTTLYAAQLAKSEGKLVSFDPNYRAPLWESPEKAASAIKDACRLADIIKLSEEELFLLSDKADATEAAKEVMSESGCSLLAVTLGRNGAFALTSYGAFADRRAYDVDTVDTTGAGDAFWGAFLHEILDTGKAPSELTSDELGALLEIANAAGSVTTTGFGAIASMPDRALVMAFLAGSPGTV